MTAQATTPLTEAQVVRVLQLFLARGWSVGRIARDRGYSNAVVEAVLEKHGGPDWHRSHVQLREAYGRLTGQPTNHPAHRPSQAPRQAPPAAMAVLRIPIRDLHAAEANVRADLGPLDELAASLATTGQVAPLVVTPMPTRPGQFRIVDGHRRHAAGLQAGLSDLLCVVTGNRSAATTTGLMLAAAMHKQLEPLEQARAFQSLRDNGCDLGEISRLTGYSTSTVRDRLRLLRLPPEARAMVAKGTLKVKDAVDLARATPGKGSARLATTPRSSRFNAQHRLADQVRETCEELEHRGGRVFVGGVGCGTCWEYAIRADERSNP